MIKVDNSNIVGVSLGNTQFSKIYKGESLYWRKGPTLIQIEIQFRDGVESITLNGVKYTETTTIYVEYNSNITWSAEIKSGYTYFITSGNFTVDEKKVYYVTVSNPSNEIWYTTENNGVISLTYGEQVLSLRDGNGDPAKVISNKFDSSSGYSKLILDRNIIYFNYTSYNFFSTYPVKTIDYLPESLEYIGDLFTSTTKIESINIGDLPNLNSIGNTFYNNMFTTNYGTNTQIIPNFELGNMNQLESIGNRFIRVYSSSNYTNNTVTIEKLKIGNMPNLKSIGNYFISVETGAGNSPQATLNINSIELGDMSNVETIGDYFFGCITTSSTLKLNTLTLPSMPKLKSVGTGAFNGITVNTIYVPEDCYDLYCDLFSNVKSKFVKI